MCHERSSLMLFFPLSLSLSPIIDVSLHFSNPAHSSLTGSCAVSPHFINPCLSHRDSLSIFTISQKKSFLSSSLSSRLVPFPRHFTPGIDNSTALSKFPLSTTSLSFLVMNVSERAMAKFKQFPRREIRKLQIPFEWDHRKHRICHATISLFRLHTRKKCVNRKNVTSTINQPAQLENTRVCSLTIDRPTDRSDTHFSLSVREITANFDFFLTLLRVINH